MSNWEFRDLPERPEQPNRSSGMKEAVIVVSIAVLAVLGLVALRVSTVYKKARNVGATPFEDPQVAVRLGVLDHENYLRDIRTAVSARQIRLSDPQLAGVKHLLDHVIAINESDDGTTFRKYFDFDRFVREMRASQLGPAFSDVLLAVNFAAGHAIEKHWVQLERVIHPGHRDRRFVATMTDDSTLFPHFRSGEPIELMAYQILGWKKGRKHE
jgi:hypothetical protein